VINKCLELCIGFFILDTAPSDLSLPRPFRFEEFWTYDASCDFVISNAWIKNFNGSLAFILSKKLKATKSTMKIWNSNHFGNIQENKNCLYSSST
jgi:hypothetical protein